MTNDELINQRFVNHENNFLFFIIVLINAKTKKRRIEKNE